MIKLYLIFFIGFVFTGTIYSQTQNDTIFNYKTTTPVIIDGQATEDCWKNAAWHPIDQVWIPWNASMKEDDFKGRFKVSWDEDYLYVLVEVVDDSLSDDHSDPLQYWWNDDCLEIFVDENRSKGDHELNCNAFAYHVSLFFDAVDLNSSGQGVNYKDNIIVDMDTIGDKTYLWEFAVKNYDATFNFNNPEASRVKLEANKKMGFALAYCDNDETLARENFIGSMKMTVSTANEMYRNADYFGLMLLQDYSQTTKSETAEYPKDIKIYPVPAHNYITIDVGTANLFPFTVSILSVTGELLLKENLFTGRHLINIEGLSNGIYFVNISQQDYSLTKKIIKNL